MIPQIKTSQYEICIRNDRSNVYVNYCYTYLLIFIQNQAVMDAGKGQYKAGTLDKGYRYFTSWQYVFLRWMCVYKKKKKTVYAAHKAIGIQFINVHLPVMKINIQQWTFVSLWKHDYLCMCCDSTKTHIMYTWMGISLRVWVFMMDMGMF